MKFDKKKIGIITCFEPLNTKTLNFDLDFIIGSDKGKIQYIYDNKL